MAAPRSRERPPRRPPKPLDSGQLEQLALAYVARFATTTAKLAVYLRRKVRERGWEGASEPPIGALVERFVGAGYIDDAVYARAKSGSLLRRGYGERRIAQALGAAGIDEEVRAEVRASEGARRRAALALARKRGFGPFGGDRSPAAWLDRARREKQIAALLRAGHPMDSARVLVDARDIAAAEDWAAAGEEEESACD